MNQTKLKNILSSNFDFEQWKSILDKMFSKIEYFTKEAPIEASLIKSGGQVGTIRLDDGRSLAIFKIEVADNIIISRNRKGLRDIAAHYVDQSLIHGAWVFYYSKNQADYRLTYIAKQTFFNADGELIKNETAPKRYTFLLGENEKCTTAASRLHELIEKKKKGTVYLADVTDAFSVERLNKEFFAGYKAQYNRFLGLRNKDNKDDRDYVKKLLGRLVFLQFLQKKGWMGVPANNKDWNDGDKNYLSNLVDKYEGNNRLLSDVLEPLFFETLNEPRENSEVNPKLGDNIKIPYLNGGLFDKDRLDRLEIDFPYLFFKELMSFFSMYNFTIDENDPDDAEIGIDPEMLGHIFENLLEDNKDKGAFYTPKEIVQYMSRESITQYLKTHTEDSLHTAIELLVKTGKVADVLQNKPIASNVYNLLKSIKVCDPAIGSGAFPMGILNVLYHCRQLLYGFTQDKNAFSPATIKREIIQENIYGIDIEQGAVDIARLRFWLALVVDEVEPQPLPNLDYKVVCGNSLLSRFNLDMPFDNIFNEYNKGKNEEDKVSLSKYKQLVADYTNTSDHNKKDEFRKTIEEIKGAFRTELRNRERVNSSKLRVRIRDLEAPMLFGERTKTEKAEVKKLKTQLAKLESDQADILNNKLYENAFEWRFEFPALLDDEGKFTGFDVVIGNPPYVNIANIKPDDYRNALKAIYLSAKNKSDLYAFFIEKGFELMTTNGVMSYIIPHTWKATDSFQNLREIIFKQHKISEIVNLSMGVFGAIVKPLIAVFNNQYQSEYSIRILNDKFAVESEIKSNEITNNATFSIDTTSNALEKALYVKIENESKQLSSIIKFSRGIKTSDDKKFILCNNLNSDCKKVFRGKNIKAYSLNWKGEYIWYRPDLMKEKIGCVPYTKDFFETPEKLITQRVNSSSQLLVAYDNSQNYFLDTTNVSKYSSWDKKISLKYLCGLLNSKLINFWYCNKYRMPTIGIYELHSIPIKISSNQQPFIEIVDKILEAKKCDPQANTSTFESEIDRMVYKLYNLTEEEVAIIEK